MRCTSALFTTVGSLFSLYLTHTEKANRLKEAKEEATREIEAYKQQREAAFQEQLKKV